MAAVVPDFVLEQRARLGHKEVAGPRGARGVGALRGRGEADGRHLGLAGEEDAEHGDGLGDDGDGGLEEVEDGHEDHEVWGCWWVCLEEGIGGDVPKSLSPWTN